MSAPNPEISTLQYFGNETAKNADLVSTELREIENINTLLHTLVNGINVATADTIVSGFSVVPQTSSMTVTVNVGLAFCLSTVELVHNYTAFSLVVPSSGSAVVYTIEAQQTPTGFNTQNRAYKDPSSNAITYQPVSTQLRYQATVQTKAGSTTVAPAHTAGWVKIAEIVVPGGTTAITSGMIKNCTGGYAGEATTAWTAETASTFVLKSVNDIKAMYRVGHTEAGVHNADIIPISTAVTLGGGTLPIGTMVTAALQTLANTGAYDLIVDSNAKLDLWCQAVAGQYKRVLVRAGAWTASALSPTSGVLINLDACGTVYAFGEKGSSINYSGAGAFFGLRHSITTSDMSLERFDNLTVNITNSAGAVDSFVGCTNLFNCTGTANGTTLAIVFAYCNNLVNCAGTSVSATQADVFSHCTNLVNCNGMSTSANIYGFDNCTNLTNCRMDATGGTAFNGFSVCTNLINCASYGTIGAVGNAYGFNSCVSLTNCTALSTGSVSATATGFLYCTGMVLCAGQGVSGSSGYGYGFSHCNKMQQNKPNGASAGGVHATYLLCYADSGTVSAVADNGAGGFNS